MIGALVVAFVAAGLLSTGLVVLLLVAQPDRLDDDPWGE